MHTKKDGGVNGVAADAAGRIYVCESLEKTIAVLDAEGSFIERLGRETDLQWRPRMSSSLHLAT